MKFFKPAELLVRKLFNAAVGNGTDTSELLTEPCRLVDSATARILILRQDRIGDVLVSTPLLQAIRSAYPKAHIGMVLSTNNIAVKGALAGLVDVIHVYNKGIKGLVVLRSQLQKGAYDIVVDCMDNPSATSAILCKSSGAPIKLGINKANRAVYTHVVPLLDRATVHIVDRLMQLAMAFGVQPENHPFRIKYPLQSETIVHVQEAIQQHVTQRLVLWNISGSDSSRMYDEQKTIRVLIALRKQFQHITFLVAASPVHALEQQRIAVESGCVSAPIFPKFDEFAALVSCASLVVTPDTSVVHLAAAFSIPSVVLYVHSNKQLLPWYPYKVQSTPLVVHEGSVSQIDEHELTNAVIKALGVL